MTKIFDHYWNVLVRVQTNWLRMVEKKISFYHNYAYTIKQFLIELIIEKILDFIQSYVFGYNP